MKNVATRSICLLMCLVLTLSLLVACGNKNNDGATTTSADETVDMPASGDGWIQGLPGYVQVEIEDEELIAFVREALGDAVPAGFKGDFSIFSAEQIDTLTSAAEAKGYTLTKELDGKYKLYKTIKEEDAVLNKDETIALVKEALGDKAPDNFNGDLSTLSDDQYAAVSSYAQSKKDFTVEGNSVYKYPVKTPSTNNTPTAAPVTKTTYVGTTVKDSSLSDNDIEKAILRATGTTSFNGNVNSLSASQKKSLISNLQKLGVSQDRVNKYWEANFKGLEAPVITITVTVPTTKRTVYSTAAGGHDATVPSGGGSGSGSGSGGSNSGTAVAITTKLTTRITTVNCVRDARNDWVKTYNGTQFNSSVYCKTDGDGGFVVGGTTMNVADTGYSVSAGMIVKYTAGGNVAWSHLVGGNELTAVSGVAELNDGSIIAVGYTVSTNFLNVGDAAYKCKGTVDSFIIKYNADGERVWIKMMGGEGDDSIYAIAATKDGGFVVGGKSTSKTLDFADFSGTIKSFVFKYSADGKYETGHAMSGTKHNAVKGLIVSPAGNVFASFTTACATGDYANIEGLTTGTYSTVVIKYTPSLAPMWWSPITENGGIECASISYSPDGGCVVAGQYKASAKGNEHTMSGYYNGGDIGTSDGCIIKFAADGTIMWVQPIIGFQNELVTGIAKVAGGYAVCGYSKSSNRDFLHIGNNGDYDSFVYLVGEYGNYISITGFSGSGVDNAKTICSNGSGITYVGGSTTSGDMFFASCDPKGALGGVAFVTKLTSTVS